MSIEIIRKKDPVGVHVLCFGQVTGQELVKMNEELASHLEFKYQIVDFTAAESVEFTPEDMHSIALQDKFIPENASLEKVATVGRKEVLNNIDSIYEVYSKVWVGRTKKFESQTFSNIEAAIEWIGC